MDTTLTEIDFISPCPVEKCKNKNKNYRWVHYNCDGREKLNDLGFIRCLKCGGEAPFISWEFDCGEHDFLPGSAQGVCHALTVMAQLSVEQEHALFIAKTTQEIMGQYTEALANKSSTK